MLITFYNVDFTVQADADTGIIVPNPVAIGVEKFARVGRESIEEIDKYVKDKTTTSV